MSNTQVFCSICSRAKDDARGLLPARYRYAGSHIAFVAERAKEMHWPLYILSGVYGFISETTPIEYYDHLLVEPEVPALVSKMVTQLRGSGVEEVHFCTKNKPQWQPYLEALQRAAARSNVTLYVHMLKDDA